MPSPRPTAMSRSPRAIALAVACTLAACASTDTAQAVRDLPPAALIVAVEPIDAPPAATPSPLRFEVGAAAMQRALADELRALDVASEVVLASELGDRRADVTLKFGANRPIELAHKGTASYLAAGGLWLVTWIGGLLVEDSTYVVRMDASCKLSANETSVDFPVGGDDVDLSFFDRNDFVSLPTLQSLILPPFWTSDQTDTTSEALSHAAIRIAAQRVAQRLKQDFEVQAANQMGCGLTIATPRNGQVANAAELPIEFVVTSREPVESVFAKVNGGAEIPLAIAGSRLEGQLRTEVVSTLRGLEPGRPNQVTLYVVLGGLTFSRTLRLWPAKAV
jgi:hypothetical protein